MTTLPISDIVEITTIIGATAVTGETRQTMLLTKDATLDAGGPNKAKLYGSLADVAREFASTTTPYRMALRYFSQQPFPKGLVIGRWTDVDVAHEIVGGAPSAVGDISASAVNDYSFRIGGLDVTGINVAANDSYTQIAGKIQTALQAVSGFGSATCAYANGRFTLSFPAAVTGIDSVATDAASGTALAGLVGLDAASGASLKVGSVAETIAEALDAIRGLSGNWYFLVLDSALNDESDMADASRWAAAKRVFASLESNIAPTGVAGQRDALVAVEPGRTLMTVSLIEDYKAISVAGRLSSVDYEAPNSVATLKFKVLPGCAPDGFSPNDVAALQAENLNFYVRYGGLPTYAEGQMMDGNWADELAWQDWFVSAVEQAVFALLRSLPKVPMNLAGLKQLRSTVEGPCRMGVLNGGLSPNQASPGLTGLIQQVTGDSNFDGYLSTGYLIHIPAVADISQGQRDARTLPPFTIFGKGAGAVHGFRANFNFER